MLGYTTIYPRHNLIDVILESLKLKEKVILLHAYSKSQRINTKLPSLKAVYISADILFYVGIITTFKIRNRIIYCKLLQLSHSLCERERQMSERAKISKKRIETEI